MQCKLITNNRYFLQENNVRAFKIEEIVFIDSLDIMTVFVKVRDMVHKGHKILTHPLSGSVKPLETPIKSIAMTVDKSDLCVSSLMMIENAIETVEKFKQGKKATRTITEDVLDDFECIDYGLIKSGLESLGGDYVKNL